MYILSKSNINGHTVFPRLINTENEGEAIHEAVKRISDSSGESPQYMASFLPCSKQSAGRALTMSDGEFEYRLTKVQSS